MLDRYERSEITLKRNYQFEITFVCHGDHQLMGDESTVRPKAKLKLCLHRTISSIERQQTRLLHAIVRSTYYNEAVELASKARLVWLNDARS